MVRILPNYALKFALDDKLGHKLRHKPLWGGRAPGDPLLYGEKLAVGTMVGLLQVCGESS